jgi:peptidoglycan/xylan/chitin deacetylase (PgdA/CDA1 family)
LRPQGLSHGDGDLRALHEAAGVLADPALDTGRRGLTLPQQPYFGYSAIVDRPQFSWPGGKRLAFHLCLNLEAFAYDTGLGISYSPGLPHPNSYNWGWREYGNRVGVWRLIKLFDQLDLPVSVLLNSEVYGHCPEVVTALRRRGDEIVGHGRTNSEHQNDFKEEGERQLIAEVTGAIRQHEGKPPAGWLSPGVNPSRVTPDLLREAGYKYLLDWPMDDQPVWMRTRSGPILSLPYPHEVNDIPMIALHHGTADRFAEMIIDNFEEMLEQSREHSLVYGVSIHAFLVGQPYRLRHFRRAMQHIRQAPDRVWFATTGQIAEHYAKLFPAG